MRLFDVIAAAKAATQAEVALGDAYAGLDLIGEQVAMLQPTSLQEIAKQNVGLAALEWAGFIRNVT